MKPTSEEKQFALRVFRKLGDRERQELVRWCFLWELAQDELPSGAIADQTSKCILEALREACVQQICRICQWSMLGRDAGVGSIRLVNKVVALTRLVMGMSDDPDFSCLLGMTDESASANSPDGCPRSDRGHYVENSGIHL